MDFPAGRSFGRDAPARFQGEVVPGDEPDGSVLVPGDRVGLHRADVADRAREHPRRPAFGDERAEVQGLVLRRLHLHPHPVEVQAGQGDAPPRREHQIAARGPDHAAVLDARREQEDAARAGLDPAPVDDVPGTGGGVEAVAPRQEVRVGDAQRRGDEPRGIDHRALAEDDAVRVDEEHPAVRQELAEDRGRVGAGDPVEHRARRGGLEEAGGLARTDREALPVDDRVRGGGDVQRVRAGAGELRGAVDHGGSFGVGVRGCAREQAGENAGQEAPGGREPAAQTISAHQITPLTVFRFFGFACPAQVLASDRGAATGRVRRPAPAR